jgi:hypothetical protein
VALRVSQTPRLPVLKDNSAASIQALILAIWRDQVDLRTTLNSLISRPVTLPNYTTALLPDATVFPYALVYDTTTSKVKVSNGTSWDVVGP